MFYFDFQIWLTVKVSVRNMNIYSYIVQQLLICVFATLIDRYYHEKMNRPVYGHID